MIRRDEIKRLVRTHYADRASEGGRCVETECCGVPEQGVKEIAGLALGCGRPLAYADVQTGATVVDLGSGAGGEVLLAAQKVGPLGRAIGVDMTAEMIGKAQESARRHAIPNAEFLLGEIERLPLPDASADVVISNCVINLVPDKAQAFREAFRVLKPGGQLVVSDVVSRGQLPEAIRQNVAAWVGCVAGAADVDAYRAMIVGAGFQDVETVTSTPGGPGEVFSVTIRARRPA